MIDMDFTAKAVRQEDVDEAFMADISDQTLQLDFVGPGRLQLLTRAALPDDHPDGLEYRLVYRVDQGERQVVRLSTEDAVRSAFVFWRICDAR